MYQGSELWDLSLVDPDNRRPIDFEERARLLDDITSVEPSAAQGSGLLSDCQDGRIKLHVTHRALSFRRGNAALFSEGEYLPLDVTGEQAARVLAFARRHEESWAVVIVPRLTAKLGFPPLGAVWGDTAVVLPDKAPDGWSNVFTGESLAGTEGTIALKLAFSNLPVAMISAKT
jgi:(1->4)-alpha-D-glucan 1-alpha-D-glucosylmutase